MPKKQIADNQNKSGIDSQVITDKNVLKSMEPNISNNIIGAVYCKNDGIASHQLITNTVSKRFIQNGGTLITFSCVNNQTNNEPIIVSDARNEDLIVLVEWSLNEGAEANLEEWNDAWSKMVIESEPLTTSWRFFINEDRSRVTMYESYTNWKGLMHHDKRIIEGDLKDRLPEVFARYKFEGVTVLGPVTDELKQFFIDIGFDKSMNNSEGELINFDYRTSVGGYAKR